MTTISGERLSFCIPAYARARELERTVRSALSQGSDADIEVVVSDDSGDMGTVVERIADPRVMYFRNPRRVDMARNFEAAVRRASGDFLCLLNDDDRVLPGFARRVLTEFRGDPAVGVVFTDVWLESPTSRRRRKIDLRAGEYADFLPVLLAKKPIVCSAAVMRRAVWADVARHGPLPDSVLADTVIWIRAALEGWKFVFVDDALVSYATGSPDKLSYQEDRMRDDGVALWAGLTFEDECSERLRQRHLHKALLLRAATRLKQGRPGEALCDTRDADAMELPVEKTRLRLTRLLARHPRWVPLAYVLWQRLDSFRPYAVRTAARGARRSINDR